MSDAVRSFDLADQHAFAVLSGDYNPIHVDPVAARRLLFGEPVVHGLHLVLWSLEEMAKAQSGPMRLGRVEAVFKSPVMLGREAWLGLSRTQGGAEVEIVADGQLAAQISIKARDAAETRAPRDAPAWPGPDGPAFPQSHALSQDDVASAAGDLELRLEPRRLAAAFPALAACADAGEVAALLASTRLVGMLCPGLHSLFSELELTFQGEGGVGPDLAWRTSFHHPDLRIAEIELEGAGVSGKLGTFVRPEPTRQLTMDKAAELMPAGSRSGQRALIIGGSRGLGEVTAKLLAAAGSDVALTYASGREDAEAVAAEITAFGGRATVHPLDIFDAGAELPEGPFSHMHYFASPKIRPGANAGFDVELHASYFEYFVAAFDRLARRFADPVEIFYPSTVFVETPEPRFAEYAAAKAAGELACRYLSAMRPKLSIRAVRLPRLRTDQNALISGPAALDPADVIQGMLAASPKAV